METLRSPVQEVTRETGWEMQRRGAEMKIEQSTFSILQARPD
jgi:hypothetical protein